MTRDLGKIMNYVAILVLVLAVCSACGCTNTSSGNGNDNTYGGGQGTVAAGTGNVNATYTTGTLSEEEEADILYISEEEKLARDVYLDYYDKWGSQVFENIADSEQTHMDSMASLAKNYGLEDRTTGDRGVFTDPDLQKLYDELIQSGSVSETDALRNAAYIEETDINDLDTAISHTDRTDIITVYENLRSGSENHLQAFLWNLDGNNLPLGPGPAIPQDNNSGSTGGAGGQGTGGGNPWT